MSQQELENLTIDIRELESTLKTVQERLDVLRPKHRQLARDFLIEQGKALGLTAEDFASIYGGGGRGTKIATKYVNPDNPTEKWTGRGRKPLWIMKKLEQGIPVVPIHDKDKTIKPIKKEKSKKKESKKEETTVPPIVNRNLEDYLG